MLRELHRQVRDTGVDGHVCRVDVLEHADPDRALFPRIHKTGFIATSALSGPAVNQVIARRAAAGYTPAQIAKLGGHSLRAGFVTEAFRQGADAHAVMRQTGHRNPAILEVYAREHAPLVGNAVTKLDGPRSISELARGAANGKMPAHRAVADTSVNAAEPPQTEEVRAVPGRVFTGVDWRRGVEARNRARTELATLASSLDDLDVRIADLERRTNQLLEG